MSEEALALALKCATAADDRKAEDIVVIDLRGISSFTDFFVVCTGRSDPQLKAMANGVREDVREELGVRPLSEDGFPASQWVVVDYGSVLVHIFNGEKREYYRIEDLWNDAPRVEVPNLSAPQPSRGPG